MTWQTGVILVVIFACVVPLFVARIISDFGTTDDWDDVAERKRRIEKRARLMSGEFK